MSPHLIQEETPPQSLDSGHSNETKLTGVFDNEMMHQLVVKWHRFTLLPIAGRAQGAGGVATIRDIARQKKGRRFLATSGRVS